MSTACWYLEPDPPRPPKKELPEWVIAMLAALYLGTIFFLYVLIFGGV